MKNLATALVCIVLMASCNKDKFTTEPQIAFQSVTPQNISYLDVGAPAPNITISITDKEGDLGLIDGTDTAWVYMKNNLTGDFDSLPFPDIKQAAGKDFKADVTFSSGRVFRCKPRAGNVEHTDSLYFDIYVRDFAKNKSNTITTTDPVLFFCQ